MKRRAFTLVELLVSITILLILSTLVFAYLASGKSSEKMRSAARVAQSAFLGAKDRALHAKDLRGVRLIRDQTDGTLVTGFAYLQPLPMQTYATGSVQLERMDFDQDGQADTADIIVLHGFSTAPAVDWHAKVQFSPNPGRVRIPAGTGQWYSFTWATSGPYAIGPMNEFLILQTPFVQTSGGVPFPSVPAFPQSNTATSSCDIQLGNDLLPFHQPITLSSGCVIDLKFSSVNAQTLAGIGTGTTPNVDLMFSPRGSISGYLSGLGPLHFLIRDLRDATEGTDPRLLTTMNSAHGDCLVLTVFPQTGLVQTFEVDWTDADADGTADDIFAFAKSGKSAGR